MNVRLGKVVGSPAARPLIKMRRLDFIPLNNVNVYLEICYLAAAPAPVRLPCQPPFKTRMFKAAWRDHALAVDQPFTITLDDFLRFTAPDKFAGPLYRALRLAGGSSWGSRARIRQFGV
jgi:hypothetical protein